jgi:hypothetical protein
MIAGLVRKRVLNWQIYLKQFEPGLALKNPPKKTHPKKPKKTTQKNPLKMVFLVFFWVF